METIPMAQKVVYNDDDVPSMASKIFNGFVVGQHCIIKGYMPNGESKGDLVLKEITRLYEEQYTYIADGRRRRKRQLLVDTIGGYKKHPIFRFKKQTIDKVPRVTIWKIQ